MKYNSLLSLMVMSTIISMHIQSLCMENNKDNGCIGPIAVLMLTRSIERQGYDTLQQTINYHKFEEGIRTSKGAYLTEVSPFYISHRCGKNARSKLSITVFNKIDQLSEQKQQSNTIEKHTTWTQTANPDVIEVTTTFDNKEDLLKALTTINNRMLKHKKRNYYNYNS